MPSKGTLNLDSFGHGFRTIWFAWHRRSARIRWLRGGDRRLHRAQAAARPARALPGLGRRLRRHPGVGATRPGRSWAGCDPGPAGGAAADSCTSTSSCVASTSPGSTGCSHGNLGTSLAAQQPVTLAARAAAGQLRGAGRSPSALDLDPAVDRHRVLRGAASGEAFDNVTSNSMLLAWRRLPEFVVALLLVIAVRHDGLPGFLPAISPVPPGSAPWEHPTS